MNEQNLQTLLSPEAARRIDEIVVFDEIDSTNVEAIRRLKAGEKKALLLLAKSQSGGRGRRGRTWLSSANAGLYMSLVLPFPVSTSNLQSLSLVTALAVHSGITAHYPAQMQLKWPNDVLAGNKKLAGILLEQHLGDERAAMVFGIGVNIRLPDNDRQQIDRPVTDLNSVTEKPVDSEILCAGIVSALVEKAELFRQSGFGQFQSDWNALDRYKGSDIVIENDNARTIGKSLGVNGDGCLMLQTLTGMITITAGEIFPSLKPITQE